MSTKELFDGALHWLETSSVISTRFWKKKAFLIDLEPSHLEVLCFCNKEKLQTILTIENKGLELNWVYLNEYKHLI